MTSALGLADVHEVHNSERLSFRGCRRRWNWVFQERWYPPLTPKPLEFGVAYHVAMEVYYNPDTWPSEDNPWSRDLNALAAIGAFVRKCEAQKEAYLKYLRDNGQEHQFDEEVRADYDERVELGKGMLRYYFDNVAPKEDAGIRPVKAEIAFQVPVLLPVAYEHLSLYEIVEQINGPNAERFLEVWQLRCTSLLCRERHVPNAPVVYAGRLDLILEDSNGDYWVLDWKTARMLSIETREAFLQTDNAIGSYCLAMVLCGIPIRGFLYHEQKKGYPKPPEQNKVQRLGCWYSKNKQQDTDYDTYRPFVEENDPGAYNAGLYDDFLNFLKAEGIVFYHRYQQHRSITELHNIGRYLSCEAADMINDPLVYPQPGRFSCESCAFRGPCIGQTAGEDYKYTLATMFDKREHYWVREEPSTETKGGE